MSIETRNMWTYRQDACGLRGDIFFSQEIWVADVDGIEKAAALIANGEA